MADKLKGTQKARTIKHGSEIASPAHRKAGLEPLMAAIAERLCRIDIETRRLEDRETDLTKSIGQLRGADGSLYITLAHHTSKGVLAADQTIESRNKAMWNQLCERMADLRARFGDPCDPKDPKK